MYRFVKGVSFLAKATRLRLEISSNVESRKSRLHLRLDVAKALTSSIPSPQTPKQRRVSRAEKLSHSMRKTKEPERTNAVKKSSRPRAHDGKAEKQGKDRLHRLRATTSQEVAQSKEAVKEKSEKTIITLPTVLTLARVVAIPLLVAGFYVQQPWSAFACCALFIAASITDWLDGFLARKMKTFSSFGAFLDPVADKLMVAAALILLSSFPVPAGHFEANKWILPMLSLMIIGREITMSSLREWAASVSKEAYRAVAVSSWGKVKTASQMTSIVLLFLACDERIPHIGLLTDIGLALLSFAAYLSLYSLALYFKGVWKYL